MTLTKQKKQTSYRYGVESEAQAVQYLEREQFRILAQRYRNAYGEIDIIAEKASRLHFIEVKARKTLDDGMYALLPRQQQRIMQCALGFIAEHPAYQQNEMQFDLIAIAGWQLHHEMHILTAE